MPPTTWPPGGYLQATQCRAVRKPPRPIFPSRRGNAARPLQSTARQVDTIATLQPIGARTPTHGDQLEITHQDRGQDAPRPQEPREPRAGAGHDGDARG